MRGWTRGWTRRQHQTWGRLQHSIVQPYVKVEKKATKQDLRKSVMKQHGKMG